MRSGTVHIGDEVYRCRVVETAAERRCGLQGQPRLAADEGLLFPMPRGANAAFHMGSVSYPIDLIFIANGQVVKIVHNAQPGSKNVWSHPVCDYVLEVLGGGASGMLGKNAQIDYIITVPNELDNPTTVPAHERYQHADPMMGPLVDQHDSKYFRWELGKDPGTQDYVEPLKHAATDDAISALSARLNWRRDALRGDLMSALVLDDHVADWVTSMQLPAEEATHAFDYYSRREGLAELAEAFVAQGVANSTNIGITPTGDLALVLWRKFI